MTGAGLRPVEPYAYPALVSVETAAVKRPKAKPEQLLAVIAEAVDDGFYPVASLISAFPSWGTVSWCDFASGPCARDSYWSGAVPMAGPI